MPERADPRKPVAKNEKAETDGVYAIESNNLSVFYNDFRAIRDVRLQIEPRRITAIIGPSGCGKSTIIRAFNRMNELVPGATTTGEVYFAGRNIYEPDVDPVEVRRRIGMVFQSSALFDSLTVGENVAFSVSRHTDMSQEQIARLVAEKLELVDLSDTEDIMPVDLSG